MGKSVTVAPPRPKSPPLNALRAFEAAARHGSFALAAGELSVTPGAVAQQIKIVEGWAGAAVFDRRAQGVTLNKLGRAVLPQLTLAFDQLGAAAQALRRLALPQAVRIAALPSVAQLWLSPRMPGLRSAFPDMRFSITALEQPPNLLREPFDLAIFFAHHAGRGMVAMALAEDALLPVCAPELARGVKVPADLNPELMLTDVIWSDDWRIWLQAAAPDLPLRPAGSAFSLYSLALEEARQGAGVLIGHTVLVAPFLADGRLTAPFGTQQVPAAPLCLHLREGMKADDPLANVADWLVETGGLTTTQTKRP